MEKQQIYTFKKEERLTNQKLISKLFVKGKSFVVYPIRVIYLPLPEEEPGNAKTLISVSKKKFKSAVKRNKVKRLIRESYRLNKGTLISALKDKNKSMCVAFIYLDTEIKSFRLLEKKITEVLMRLGKEIK